ncbi:nuclear transport factor 2 family protein [Mycolicibacterium palauense]|uniref:nuclear transport factor 2 family protein n=1 Tax=Mycolicibacterium palauense TaxID=2034511 RepID=UPI0011453A12|nr:nuclear transport factor 2 family protein [Mycolicibacterium palauense]
MLIEVVSVDASHSCWFTFYMMRNNSGMAEPGQAPAAGADVLERLERLEAQDTIRRLKAAYMQGLDDRLRGAVADLFWEDAIWESLPDRPLEGDEPVSAGSRIVGREAIAESFVAAASAMSFTSHFLTNEEIAVDGDAATGRWKLLQTCNAGRDRAFWQAGIYIDDFVRREGQWKFSHLRLALDFRTPFDVGWLDVRMWDPARPG